MENQIELLRECKIQLEYLNEKFGETGTTNSLLSKINNALDVADSVKKPFSEPLFVFGGTLTKKQEFMLNYLKENSNYANGKAVEYVSPTEVGMAYGKSQGKNGYHSSTASPVLLKLSKMGLVKRNDNGHYKYCG